MKKKKRRSSGHDSEKMLSDNDFDESGYGHRKMNIDDQNDDHYSHSSKRDPSPELARISALITHPPKQKHSSRSKCTHFHTTTNLHNISTVPSRYQQQIQMIETTVERKPIEQQLPYILFISIHYY